MKYFLALLALAFCNPASAKTLNATPATIAANISAALGGDTITMAPGNYGKVLVTKRLSPPVTVNATGATMQLAFKNASGFSFKGGTYVASKVLGPVGYTIHILNSDHLTFDNVTMRDAMVGSVIDKSSFVRFTNWKAIGMISDGIDCALCSDTIIEDGSCTAFITTPAKHADCVQLWGDPKTAVKRVTVQRNKAVGNMQGFSGFAHGADLGYDSVKLINNYAEISYSNAVNISRATNTAVANNTAVTRGQYTAVIRLNGKDIGGRWVNGKLSGNLYGNVNGVKP